MPFHGQTVLWHVIKKCDLSGFPVVVAIPGGDKELLEWLVQNQVVHFCGHPTDLTRRYLGAAEEYGADPIIRITADSPFIFPDLIKLTARLFELQGNEGYIGSHFLHGLNVEIFDRKTLEKAAANGEDEHCTTWMRRQKWAKTFPDLELNTKGDYHRLLTY